MLVNRTNKGRTAVLTVLPNGGGEGNRTPVIYTTICVNKGLLNIRVHFRVHLNRYHIESICLIQATFSTYSLCARSHLSNISDGIVYTFSSADISEIAKS